MRALALSIAPTLAQPGVLAAAQSPAADEPERVLATELPTRAEVWARMEAAIAQMVEEAGADGVVDGLRFQSNASWVLSAYGEHRRAADLALAAAETLRDQFGYRDAWSETQSIFTALEEAGLDAEVARLAGDLAETGRALIAAAETEDESSRLSWNLLSALPSYPEIQDTIAERMLSYHFHDVQDQEDLLRLMIGNALETGNRARALHLASVQIQLQRTGGVEPD